MKNILSILLLSFLSLNLSSQSKEKSFELKAVQSDSLKKQFEESNYQMNIIMTYFKKHYTLDGGKTGIQKDEEMGGDECAFTQKFKEGITYSYHNCGEAKPVEETVVFPLVDKKELKKWIEGINASYPMDIKNIWYKGKNEYGPEDEEAGCYYKIISSKKNMMVEIWCGS